MPSEETTTVKTAKKRVWPKVLLGIVIFLVALAAAIFITVNFMLNKINRLDQDFSYATESEVEEINLRDAVEQNETEDPGVVYPELDKSAIDWGNSAYQIQASPDITNILLIGQDRREGETRARSDSMILVSFNQSAGTIVLISFLRDLYVQIPGYSSNRLNAAFAYGGMELLDETLEENFGVEIDYNLEVDFSGFASIIDILGGVDIDLTSSEANYLGLNSGVTHMDGETALAYSRIRYIDSDFSRTGRQRKVLISLYQSLKNVGLTEAIHVVNEVFPLLTTDMSNFQIIATATELFPMLSDSAIASYQIPADGTWSYNTVDGMSVIIPDFDANRDVIAEALTPEA